MKKKIAIIAIVLGVIVLAIIAGITAVVISRPKEVKVHCYKVVGIDWGIYEGVPAYWNKEAQQWRWVEDDSPVPERLVDQIQGDDMFEYDQIYFLWCVEGFTPWDCYYGDGIPRVDGLYLVPRTIIPNDDLCVINGEKCKVEWVYEY